MVTAALCFCTAALVHGAGRTPFSGARVPVVQHATLAPRPLPVRAAPARTQPWMAAAAAVSTATNPRGLERIRFTSTLNLVSLIFVVNCLVWGLLITPAMLVACLLDKRRVLVSRLGNLWGRVVLLASGYRTKVLGAENLPPADEAVMYVSNHCSYLDIPVTGLLGRPFKYVAKAEVKKIPVVGWKLGLAKDLCVARGDRRSEARVFVDAVKTLKEGLAVIAFPEGTTTPTGRLLPFKRGPFKMAVSAGARVVPLTIVGTYQAWPKGFKGPQYFTPLSIQVHPPLDPTSLTEEELCDKAAAAIESGLPPEMRS